MKRKNSNLPTNSINKAKWSKHVDFGAILLALNPGTLLSAIRQVTGIIFASVFFIQDVLTWTIFSLCHNIASGFLLLLFCFVLFGQEAHGILVPQPGN